MSTITHRLPVMVVMISGLASCGGTSPSCAATQSGPAERSNEVAKDGAVAKPVPAPEVFVGRAADVPRIGELAWDPETFPESLPAHPLRAVLAGEGVEPRDVVWTHMHGAVQVGFFVAAHEGCDFHWFAEDGVSVRLGPEPPQVGARFERVETTPTLAIHDSPGKAPDMTGAAQIQLPGPRPGTRSTSLAGAVALEVDALEETMRGRVYVASRGGDRSLLVGAFAARHCEVMGR